MSEAAAVATPATTEAPAPTSRPNKGGTVTFGASNLKSTPSASAPATDRGSVAADPLDASDDTTAEPKTKYKVYGKDIDLTDKQARDAVEKYYASQSKLEELKTETAKAKEAQKQHDQFKTNMQNNVRFAAQGADQFGEFIEGLAKAGNLPKLIDSAIHWVVNMASEEALPADQKKFKQEQRSVQRDKARIEQFNREQQQTQVQQQENQVYEQIDKAMPSLLQTAGLPDKPATRYRVLEVAKFLVQKGQTNAMNLAVQRVRQEYDNAGMLPASPTKPTQTQPKRRATPESVGQKGRQKAPAYKSFEDFEKERKGRR